MITALASRSWRARRAFTRAWPDRVKSVDRSPNVAMLSYQKDRQVMISFNDIVCGAAAKRSKRTLQEGSVRTKSGPTAVPPSIMFRPGRRSSGISSCAVIVPRRYASDTSNSAPTIVKTSISAAKSISAPTRKGTAKAAAAKTPEGGAPFRYPLAWQDPSFYDEAKLEEVPFHRIN